MPKKTKKEHFVPQLYLNAWSIPGKHQIYVYDTLTNTQRINSINDVASERFFYDVNPSEIFTPDYLDVLRKNNMIHNQDDVDSQLIERALSEEIEKPFSDILKCILNKAESLTQWETKNCCFISKSQKQLLSIFLAIQFLRGKTIRDNLHDMSNCISQILKEMSAPTSVLSEYDVTKKQAKNIHIKMMLNDGAINDFSQAFHNLTWILGVNKTDIKLFTSDNPIITRAHISDSIVAMNGIASKGVEVVFPLSPNVILIMVDGSYHTDCLPFERRYFELSIPQMIDNYNLILASQSN